MLSLITVNCVIFLGKNNALSKTTSFQFGIFHADFSRENVLFSIVQPPTKAISSFSLRTFFNSVRLEILGKKISGFNMAIYLL